MRTPEAGNAGPPGFELDSTKSFKAYLTTSWAWSLLPSPPDRPKWHCHANKISIRMPGKAEYQRGLIIWNNVYKLKRNHATMII
jgi:hypothetical protein